MDLIYINLRQLIRYHVCGRGATHSKADIRMYIKEILEELDREESAQ